MAALLVPALASAQEEGTEVPPVDAGELETPEATDPNATEGVEEPADTTDPVEEPLPGEGEPAAEDDDDGDEIEAAIPLAIGGGLILFGFVLVLLRDRGLQPSTQKPVKRSRASRKQSFPAGWYRDPKDPAQQRYWDGKAWTEHRAPVGTGPSR